jgi:uncharacterized DUF497 family protein
MRYEWNERKNWQNQRKHEGVSFELAIEVFEDESCLISLDRVDETGEQRWLALGAVSTGSSTALIVLVAHVYREDLDGEEIVRIISARRAGKNDVRRYQKQEVE